MSAMPDVVERSTTGDCANIVGRAGEHIACAELLAAGYEAWLTEGKARFDLVAQIGARLVRIQVKTTAGVKACPQRKNWTPVYSFSARRYGKGGREGYAAGDADLIAYVALDRKLVAWLPAERVAQSSVFRLEQYAEQYVCKTGMFIERFPLSKALEGLNA